jgi:serine/threonine protein kinase
MTEEVKMPLQTGTILNNRYRILSILGQGGFGAVYRAADMTLKRPCAVKENLDTSPEARRQFEKEAIVLAQLSHPNLPRVQDHFIIPDQGQYLVMDFIEGQDLQAIVSQGGRVDPETALDWVGQIASALAYLHEQKPPIIHRDIKPANIRVTEEGKAFLVDFGLVKVYDPHLRTTLGARAVTPGYSPPEQYGQGNTDARTDVYALGATLYHLLTGLEPPESVQRVIEDQLIPLSAANMRVQEAMSAAVGKAMDLRPSGRYHSVKDFENALKSSKTRRDEAMATVQVVEPLPMPVPESVFESVPAAEKSFEAAWQPDRTAVAAKKPIWKQPWLYLGLLVLLALCVGGAYGAYQLLKPEEEAEVETVVVSATADTESTDVAKTQAVQTQQAQENASAALTSQAETQAAPSNTPPPPPPSNTPLPSPTLTPFDTFTPVPTDTPPLPTNTKAPPSSYFVIDNWCLSHEGCATIDVRNQSDVVSSWHIWNTEFGVDTTFQVYPGISTIKTRPGKYNFHITYCGGEVADFAWQLNSNWYYKISPCD